VLLREEVTAKKMPVLVRGKSLTNLLIFCKGPSEKTELRRTKDMNGRFSFTGRGACCTSLRIFQKYLDIEY